MKMPQRKFTDKEVPAWDIHELLRYLNEEDQEASYVYRGQVKEYNAPLMPSRFRRHISYADQGIDRADPLYRHSLKKIGSKYYGDYVANFQMYRNEVFDNVNSAKKHKIQDVYEKALRSPLLLLRQQSGRILYNNIGTRLDLIRSILSKEEWYLFSLYKDRWMPVINNYDRRIIRMFGFFKPLGYLLGTALAQQYGFSSEGLDATKDLEVAAFFATHDSQDYYDRTLEDGIGIIYRFPYQQAYSARDGGFQYDFYSPHSLIDIGDIFENLVYDAADINDFFSAFEAFYTKKMKGEDADYGLLKLPKDSYQKTRIFRQKAVILLADEIREDDEKSELSIIGNRLPRYQYIEDLSSREGVEKFYFWHSKNNGSTLKKEYLWPREDPLLYLIVWIISAICQMTFSKDKHFIMYRLDLIDAGYDPGEFLTICQNIALEQFITISKNNTIILLE